MNKKYTLLLLFFASMGTRTSTLQAMQQYMEPESMTVSSTKMISSQLTRWYQYFCSGFLTNTCLEGVSNTHKPIAISIERPYKLLTIMGGHALIAYLSSNQDNARLKTKDAIEAGIFSMLGVKFSNNFLNRGKQTSCKNQ